MSAPADKLTYRQREALGYLVEGTGVLKYEFADDMDCVTGECPSGYYAQGVPYPGYRGGEPAGTVGFYIHHNTVRWLYRMGYVRNNKLTDEGRRAYE
jgi:hypothetical protein